MNIKSVGIPQNLNFDGLVLLLQIVADPTKYQSMVLDLADDIKTFSESYKSTQIQIEELNESTIKADGKLKDINEESKKLDEKQNACINAISALELREQSLSSKQQDLIKQTSDNEDNMKKFYSDLMKAQKASDNKMDEAIILANKADALIAEYETKLNRMKEMVG